MLTDHQALLQPGSKLRIVRPLEDLVVPHGMPGKLPPQEDRILEEDRAEPGEAEEAQRRHVVSLRLQEIRIGVEPGQPLADPGPHRSSNPPCRPAEIPLSSAGTSGEAGPRVPLVGSDSPLPLPARPA